MPKDEKEYRQDGERQSEVAGDSSEQRLSPDSIKKDAGDTAAEVQATAAAFVDQAQKDIEENPELQAELGGLVEEMREVIADTNQLEQSLWQRLDAYFGITAVGKRNKKAEQLAIPDNPKIKEQLRKRIKDIEESLKKMMGKAEKSRGGFPILSEEELPWDNKIIQEILDLATDYKEASKHDRDSWAGINTDVSELLGRYIKCLLYENNIEEALQIWKMMPNDRVKYKTDYTRVPPMYKTAQAIYDAIKMPKVKNLEWDEFQKTQKRAGLFDEEIHTLWRQGWRSFMEDRLAGHPDLWMIFLAERRGHGMTASRENQPDELEAIRNLLNQPDRHYFVGNFSFFPGWTDKIDPETKQKLFTACLENHPELIIRHFDDFQNEFSALSDEQRATFITQWTEVIGRLYKYQWKKRHDRKDIELYNNPHALAAFERITLKPEEMSAVYEALLPHEDYYRYEKKKDRPSLREADQKKAYEDVLGDLAAQHPRGLLRNGPALIGYNDQVPEGSNNEQGVSRLIDTLISQERSTVVYGLLANLEYYPQDRGRPSRSNGDKCVLDATQAERIIAYTLDKQEKDGLEALVARIYELDRIKLSAGLSERLVTVLIESASDKMTAYALGHRGTPLSLDQFTSKQVHLFIDAVKRRGEQQLFNRFLEYVHAAESPLSAMPEVQMAQDYSQKTSIFHTSVFGRYTELHAASSREEANRYLDGLQEKSKGVIGDKPPEDLRKLPEYLYLVKLVFPEGNYSTHEKNLACGDRLEHLAEYDYDATGYSVELTGLLGYRLRTVAEADGTPQAMADDIALYRSYEKRLGNIREFVASRGPDNKSLQEAFDKKVDAYFDQYCEEAFRSIGPMNAKEKMLSLFISEAVRREKEKKYTPNRAILDLVVEYKYAYHEDLEAYVQRSAGDVSQYKDETSQRFVMWQELSNMYGENVKHVLRHNIFEELAAQGKQYEKIVDTFGQVIGGQREERKMKPKQLERIENTFNNPNIPMEDQTIEDKATGKEKIKPGKYNVLVKQIKDIFGANIKFNTDEEQANFEEEIGELIGSMKNTFTFNSFQELLPQLFSLRERYRFGINTKLEELFTLDLNAINREVAKFEEIVETEEKETRMGGPKDKKVKKSVKKRKIRGYFTKTQETANARMGAYVCIAGDEKMWENPDYFEFVDKDEETGKCVGVAMLLRIKANNGKKYLWFGPNPFESFLTQVSAEKAFDHMYDSVVDFASQNGFDGVVVPAEEGRILGACTNRGGTFPDLIKAKRLRNKKGEVVVADFGQEHKLGGGYGYKDGALIWKKAA